MIDLLLRSIFVALAAFAALALARRASAAVRHVIVVAGLAAVLALPLFQAGLPAVRVPILPAPPVPTTVTVVPNLVRPTAVLPQAPFAVSTPRVEKPFPWAGLWMAGSLLLLLRWVSGWLWLHRRLCGAHSVQGLDVAVLALESDALRTPVVAWLGRATIVLPTAWREWPTERLDVVLRHEMAHVQRGDGWSLLIARLACAVFWPNPLVWFLARAEARLAERATDDLVMAGGIPAWAYAQQLLAIAQEPTATGPLPALGMAQKAEVAQRVEMILEPNTPRTTVKPRARLATIAVALALSVPVATWALGRQAEPPAKKPSMSVAVTAVANPIAFRLRCKVVRAEPSAKPVSTGSLQEPQIGQADPSRVLTTPDLYTGNGVPVALKVTLDGTERTVEIRPTTGDDLKSTVQIHQSLPFKGSRMSYADMWAQARPNSWLSYPITDFKGQPTGYQMLVQVMPYKDQDSTPVLRDPAARKFSLIGKLVKSDRFKGQTIGVSAKEPVMGLPGKVEVLASPKIATTEGQSSGIHLQDGGRDIEVTMKVMPLSQTTYTLMLDSKLQLGKGIPQNLSVVATVHGGEWLRVAYRDGTGKFRGYQLLVRLIEYRV